MQLIVKYYGKLIGFGFYFAPFVLLAIRLTWGWELFESGMGHLNHLDKTTAFFESLHIPFPHANAVMCGTTELTGGILFMSGLASRLIAIPVFFNFCVAYATDAPDTVKHIFTDPDKFIDYAAFPFLITALIMIAFGPGILSLDEVLKRTLFDKHRAALSTSR
jgi:putative oxidoreductase